MGRLHVLAFEEAAGFGGAFVVLRHVLECLTKAGARVSVARSYDDVCWSHPSLAAAHLLPAHRSLGLARRVSAESMLGKPVRMAAASAELIASQLPTAARYADFARSQGVDLIFLNNTPMINVVGVLTGVMSGVPIVSYLQGHQYKGRLVQLLLPRISHFFGTSRFIAGNIRDMGVPPEKIGILYNGMSSAPKPVSRRATGRVCVGMTGM